jgi:hypothetical protein
MTSTRQGLHATRQGAFTGENIAGKQGNGNRLSLRHPASSFIQDATLKQCINALVDRAVRTCGAQALSQALLDAKRVISVLCVALRPFFKVEVRRDG